MVSSVEGSPRWDRADANIHVSSELLNSEEAAEFIAERYEIGEPCGYGENVVHARLRGAL